MSNIKELVDRLCPDGVPFKTLGEVLGYEQPTKYIVKSTEYDDSYSTPVLTAGQSFILGYTDETQGVFHASKQNPVIIFDDFTTSFHWVDFDFKVKSSAMKMLRATNECVIFRYVFYAMSCINYVPTQHTRHWISVYANFTIPVPPIEVQEEIVRILDLFCKYIDVRKEELQARKEQYEYYRNLLLSFKRADDAQETDSTAPSSYKVVWKTMGEIMDISRGASPRPIQSFLTESELGVPWIKIGDISPDSKYVISTAQRITKEGAAKSRLLHKGDFILSNSMSFGRPYILAIDGCIHDGWVSLQNFQGTFLSDFLYHLLKSDYVQNFWQKNAGQGGAITNLNADIIRKTPIPIPPIKVQEEIVGVLDKFEALVNDLTQGLPAEIAAQQERYEYYRNKLLTFKELR